MADDHSGCSFADDDNSGDSDYNHSLTRPGVGAVQHDGSVSSTTVKDDDHPAIPSFRQYDRDSDRFDDEIQAPTSREDERLFREIEDDHFLEQELGRSLTRAALFNSPLLLAATSEVVKSGRASSDVPRESYSPLDQRDQYGSESGSDLDRELNEVDLRFGGNRGESFDDDRVSPVFVDESMDQTIAGGSSRMAKYRRYSYIAGWTLAVILILAIVIVVGVRQSSMQRNSPSTQAPVRTPSTSMHPSPPPSQSSRPTQSSNPTTFSTTSSSETPSQPLMTISPSPSETTAQPTIIISLSPSETPSQPIITISPSSDSDTSTLQPIPRTLSPTSSFSSAQPSTSPTSQPSPKSQDPTQNPSASSSTQLPVQLQDSSSPSTVPSQRPVQSMPPTTTTNSSTSTPSYAPEEKQRRSRIIALATSISGVMVLLDSRSPQYKALQWILNDDPLMLEANNTPAIIQRYALSTLYFATNGDTAWISCASPLGSSPCSDEWRRFLSGETECLWLGIACDFDQQITSINIRANGLQGQLPRELGELSLITSLSFGGNAIYGTIPTTLEYLSLLRFLILNNNDYSNSIPTQLGRLTALSYLHLGSNRFAGTIPSEIFVSSLRHVNIANNQLDGTIPSTIHTVSLNLEHIDFSNNQISGTVPTGLGDLEVLGTLTLSNNSLTGTFPGMIVANKLATLDLGSNQLVGTLPIELYLFGSSLTFLNLGQNRFDGTLSSGFGELVRLQTLVFFFNNGLNGTIPSELGRLTNLRVLHLAATSLEGTMPNEVCSLIDAALTTLTSDCQGVDAEVQCSCCTFCF